MPKQQTRAGDFDRSIESLVSGLRESRERFRKTTEQELRELQSELAGIGSPKPDSTLAGAPIVPTGSNSERHGASSVEPLRERLRELKAHMASQETGVPLATTSWADEPREALVRRIGKCEQRGAELRAELESASQALSRESERCHELEQRLRHEGTRRAEAALAIERLEVRLRAAERAERQAEERLADTAESRRALQERANEAEARLGFAQQELGHRDEQLAEQAATIAALRLQLTRAAALASPPHARERSLLWAAGTTSGGAGNGKDVGWARGEGARERAGASKEREQQLVAEVHSACSLPPSRLSLPAPRPRLSQLARTLPRRPRLSSPGARVASTARCRLARAARLARRGHPAVAAAFAPAALLLLIARHAHAAAAHARARGDTLAHARRAHAHVRSADAARARACVHPRARARTRASRGGAESAWLGQRGEVTEGEEEGALRLRRRKEG